MFRLTCNITIGNLEFDYVHRVEVDSSWKLLTDTAEIMLPKKLKLGNQKITDIIKTGQAVNIQLGYDDQNLTYFDGYVTSITPNIPFTVKCEDEMWQLKRKNITINWPGGKLSDLISKIAPGYTVQCFDAVLSPISRANITPASILNELKSIYGIRSFFQNKILYVGFAYPLKNKEVIYDFYQNIISNNLVFRVKEENLVTIKGISVQPTGQKYEVELGDKGGEIITLSIPGLDFANLKKFVQMELDRIKVDGYKGSFTTFGEPFAQHGMTAILYDDEYPERAGNFLIDAVKTTFGMDGFRHITTLGPKSTIAA